MRGMIADIGGTNARLALVENGMILDDSICRFRGDDYPSFDEVVSEFLKMHSQPPIDRVAVAVAGPVADGSASLTNRDWEFSERVLARQTGAGHATLLNDLMALGFATPALHNIPDGLAQLRNATEARRDNGQALVVGAGTGFNVCAVRHLFSGGITALEAEQGHVNLPRNLVRKLDEYLENPDKFFLTNEDLFSGNGLATFHAQRTGTEKKRAEKIWDAAQAGDADAEETFEIYSGMFGMLLRELTLQFMPFQGLYLAGSVARSLSGRIDMIEEAMLSESYMRAIPDAIPIYLIQDDMAALHGCLRALG